MAALLVLLLALLGGFPLPLAAVQILWINTVTQGTVTVNLVLDPPDGGEMRLRPVPREDRLLSAEMLRRVALMTPIIASITFGWFAWRLLGSENGVMHKPLVPIDGSASAMRALEHALVELLGRADAQLHLLNVQAAPIHPFPGRLVSPDLIDQELRREGAALLEPAEASVRATGISTVCHVRIGHPADEIAACAAERGCDTIVMGTRGMGTMAGLLLGSVATKVVHLAQVPVTLVK